MFNVVCDQFRNLFFEFVFETLVIVLDYGISCPIPGLSVRTLPLLGSGLVLGSSIKRCRIGDLKSNGKFSAQCLTIAEECFVSDL